MKVLVVGSGGREHAITYSLNKSEKVDKLYCIPGNPGIAEIAECVNGSVTDLDFISNFVEENQIDLTVVGPEVPLCMGLADKLHNKGFKVFGPQQKAANLEGSKIFSKAFMMKHDIPTALYKELNNYDDAIKALDEFNFPVVIKADGLAAGKGVVIAENRSVAEETLKSMMIDGALDNAGKELIIEEFLTGFECSLLCFTDGETIKPMVYAKDHKQIYDGNKGPNTGGMGTVSPNPFMPEGLDKVLEETILMPFMKGLKEENMELQMRITRLEQNGYSKNKNKNRKR